MSRVRIVDAATLERVLFALGFQKSRQKGSHAFYRHPDGRGTSIPHHQGRDLARPPIREILREIDVPRDEDHRVLDTV